MSSRLLLKADLDAAGCAAPDCGHDHDQVLVLHARCHRSSAVDVRYEKRLGHLVITCHKCGYEVARIAPAERIV